LANLRFNLVTIRSQQTVPPAGIMFSKANNAARVASDYYAQRFRPGLVTTAALIGGAAAPEISKAGVAASKFAGERFGKAKEWAARNSGVAVAIGVGVGITLAPAVVATPALQVVGFGANVAKGAYTNPVSPMLVRAKNQRVRTPR
jgi:hypothetical protein